MAKQLSLFDDRKPAVEHGGTLSCGKRKGPRPFIRAKPLHLVLRSSHAKGTQSLHLHREFILQHLTALTRKWGITVYQFSNNSNHLHLLIRARDRGGFQNFLRAFSGTIAMRVTGSGKTRKLKTRFWDQLAYTRIVMWGRHFRTAFKYVVQNILETNGVIPYKPRTKSRSNLTSRPPPPI